MLQQTSLQDIRKAAERDQQMRIQLTQRIRQILLVFIM